MRGMGIDGMQAIMPFFVPLPHHDTNKYLRERSDPPTRDKKEGRRQHFVPKPNIGLCKDRQGRARGNQSCHSRELVALPSPSARATVRKMSSVCGFLRMLDKRFDTIKKFWQVFWDT